MNLRLCKILLCAAVIYSKHLHADLSQYIYPNSSNPSYSNYGTIGIIQMPNARMLPAGSLGFSWSSLDPYLRGSIVAYPFNWLEASYQYTDINNALYSDVKDFSGGQTYKDKSFDIKLRILKEHGYFPAIAIGARDIAGTGVFSSEYIVASKMIGNIDFSLGLGWGALSKQNYKNIFSVIKDEFKSRQNELDTLGGEINFRSLFRGEMGVFAGIEYYLPNLRGARLKLEYDATDYRIEGFPFGRDSFKFAFEPVRKESSDINIGILFPLNEHVNLKVGYIKGNTLNFGFSIKANFADTNNIVKKDDPLLKVENPEIVKRVLSRSPDLFYKGIQTYLNEREIFVQKANITDDELEVVYTQSKYISSIQSASRTSEVLDQIVPDNINQFKLSLQNAGLGINSITIDRDNFSNFKADDLKSLALKSIEINPFIEKNKYDYSPQTNYPYSFLRVSPEFRSQIGGPDGFYFGDIRFSISGEILLSKNMNIVHSTSIGIINNFDSLKLASDSVLPHVRSDIVKYLKESEKYGIKRLQFNYFNKNQNSNIFSKFSFGMLEEMFAGYGGEVLYRPFYSNYALGAELWKAKQRDYDQMFSFLDYEITTGHINFYYLEPNTNILFSTKAGRFLAGDSGFRFDFQRVFNSGFRVGVFFALTDVSEQEFGEGSFDKGFYFFFPIEMFFNKHSSRYSSFGIRPVTRDGAQALVHGQSLWGVTNQANFNDIYRNRLSIYE